MLSNVDYMNLILNNFCLSLFTLAVLFILLHKIIVRGRVRSDENVYRWMALFPLGVGCIYLFILQVFYPEIPMIEQIWPESPYQFQVGMADLAIGITAILSFNASYGFRLATVMISVVFLMGSAYPHLYPIVTQPTYQGIIMHMGKMESWLWMNDLVLPLVMFLCMNSLSRQPKP